MVAPAKNAQTVFVSFKNLCQALGRFCGHCYCKFCQELPLVLNRQAPIVRMGTGFSPMRSGRPDGAAKNICWSVVFSGGAPPANWPM